MTAQDTLWSDYVAYWERRYAEVTGQGPPSAGRLAELVGKWMPRRNLDEAAVVVGDRAWLPFLRARHCLQGREAPLDSSLTQLFRQAWRLRG